MFNKELRLMKSYIRKKGTNTVTKTDVYENNPVIGSYETCLKLPTNTKITQLNIGKVNGSYSGSYGEGDYSGRISTLELTLSNNSGSSNKRYVWSVDGASNKTYYPNVAALYLYLTHDGNENTDTYCFWSTTLKITYEYSSTEEYDYIVKY